MKYNNPMLERAREARQKQWYVQRWTPSPALSTKTSEGTCVTKYIGQKYDPKKTKLIEDGWDHDHCLFCQQSICACGGENCVAEGFTNGDQWICRPCYERIIVNGQDPATN